MRNIVECKFYVYASTLR